MVDELQDTNARAARADRRCLARTTCSRSATPSSRSTRSATRTWSCSSGAASWRRRAARARRCGRTSARARRSSRCSTGVRRARVERFRAAASRAASDEPARRAAGRAADRRQGRRLGDRTGRRRRGGWPRRARSRGGSRELIARRRGPGTSSCCCARRPTCARTSARSRSAGCPTYVIGGRGYWSHPQVVDLVAYLRALANPRDEESPSTACSPRRWWGSRSTRWCCSPRRRARAAATCGGCS